MTSAPSRPGVIDELGARKTLLGGPDSHRLLFEGQSGGPTLLLGLGPEPASAPTAGSGEAVFYLEAPEFVRQMPPSWRAAVPAAWRPFDPAGAPAGSFSRIYLYRQAVKLFPSFWGPLLARLALETAVPPAPDAAKRPTRTGRRVLLLSRKGQLLRREVVAALEQCGCAVTVIEEAGRDRLLEFLGRGAALFCLSLNFAGLDRLGENFYLLRAAGLPVAAWCVDNPWLQLSAFKASFWRKLFLFVTDHSFIPALEALGATHVHHLPLAAAPPVAGDSPGGCGLAGRLLFAGRSAFPGKESFFAGCRLPEDLWRQAESGLEGGSRPDFNWWTQKLGVEAPWPDHPRSLLRRAAFGCEQCSRQWRARCLTAAAGSGRLSVIGDAAWRELAPGLEDLRPPVDYYHDLPASYRRAAAVLNMTSLLLPGGLTQRHFDVWAAGGFLLSDRTPGLDIFPAGLSGPITFSRPDEVPELFAGWLERPGERRELAAAWRDCILKAHTYARRMRRMLEIVLA